MLFVSGTRCLCTAAVDTFPNIVVPQAKCQRTGLVHAGHMQLVVTPKEIVTDGQHVMKRARRHKEEDHECETEDYLLMMLLERCGTGHHDAYLRAHRYLRICHRVRP